MERNIENDIFYNSNHTIYTAMWRYKEAITNNSSDTDIVLNNYFAKVAIFHPPSAVPKKKKLSSTTKH